MVPRRAVSRSPMTAMTPMHVSLDTPLARHAGAAPMQRQLHDRLKDAILDGRLAPGSRLPSSRELAQTLGISRNTVTAAYDQLAAQGYVYPDRRGTLVATLARPASPDQTPESTLPPVLAQRISQIRATLPVVSASASLRPGMPSYTHFPMAAWRRALDSAVRTAGPSALGYGDPLGEPALRASIARHLGIARSVRCDPEQVIITEGAHEALALCVSLLSNPGETAWIEDPGYRGARSAFNGGDLRVEPMAVDAEGMVWHAEDWHQRSPRLIYTTPSHQYPTGAVLSVSRRLALIEQARRHQAWIIEDDYDSEFRHVGDSIAAMQGLVADAPVVYVGTFSKTMFPSLRLGFVVLPQTLAQPARDALHELLRGGHRYEQLALADFIESGQFSRHLNRMRRLYRERQGALREALTEHLQVPHVIEGGHCGMHLTVRLPAECPDWAICTAAQRYGIGAQPLSAFSLRPGAHDNGLVLGYGNTSAELYRPLIQRLSRLARGEA